MTAWEALFLTGISFGSMWACYCIGIREGISRKKKESENE